MTLLTEVLHGCDPRSVLASLDTLPFPLVTQSPRCIEWVPSNAGVFIIAGPSSLGKQLTILMRLHWVNKIVIYSIERFSFLAWHLFVIDGPFCTGVRYNHSSRFIYYNVIELPTDQFYE